MDYKTKKEHLQKIMWVGILATLFWASVVMIAGAEEIDIDKYVDAIYWAEGGRNAKKPFGILSVKCDGYDDCRKICYNTVRNNIKRWNDAGRKTDYLTFLANRYAPVGVANDPTGLNKNWYKNVKWFYENSEGR